MVQKPRGFFNGFMVVFLNGVEVVSGVVFHQPGTFAGMKIPATRGFCFVFLKTNKGFDP